MLLMTKLVLSVLKLHLSILLNYLHIARALQYSLIIQGPVVQSPISANPRLTLNKTYEINPGLPYFRRF